MGTGEDLSEPAARRSTASHMGAAAVIMVAAVFLSRIIGFGREVFIAGRFGANWETDAYNAAFTIPDWLNYLVAGGTLSITLLPIYAKHLADDDEAGGNRVLGIVMTIMLAVVGAGVIVGEIFAEPLIRAFFHKLDPRALDAAVRYTRILLPAQLFFFAGGLANATLFARGRFGAAALAPLLYNVGIIASGVMFGGVLGVGALAWGALVGAAVGPFAIPAVHAWRLGARARPSFAPRHPGFVEWVKLSLPLMIGVSLVTADDWVLRYFASADTGAITRLNYAKRLVAVAIAVTGQAVGQASMPFFTRLYAEGKRDELAETFTRTARTACIVSALVAAWMAALAAAEVDLLFRRGHFVLSDVGPTAAYLAIFAAALPAWTLQALVARAFYSVRNTLTPMIAGTIVTVASLPIYGLLFRAWGPAGLAAASGVGIAANTLTLALLVPRVLPEVAAHVGHELRALVAGFALAVAAGAATWVAARGAAMLDLRGHLDDVVVLGCGSVAFLMVVVALAGPLGVEEPRLIWGRIVRRGRAR